MPFKFINKYLFARTGGVKIRVIFSVEEQEKKLPYIETFPHHKIKPTSICGGASFGPVLPKAKCLIRRSLETRSESSDEANTSRKHSGWSDCKILTEKMFPDKK